MAANYARIPILEAARRCGLALDHRTLRREEVEASCPFCGDHGRGKYHLSLNPDLTNTDATCAAPAATALRCMPVLWVLQTGKRTGN